jgi:hypothetical protein
MSYEQYSKYNKKLLSSISLTELRHAANSGMLTSFIYALAEFEKEFGAFWGHNDPVKSSDQQIYFDRYQILRKRILDNGNNQMRKFNMILDKNIKESQ